MEEARQYPVVTQWDILLDVIFAGLFGLLVARSIADGHIWRTPNIARAEMPGVYWLGVALFGALALMYLVAALSALTKPV